jgi:inosose dehydratase
VIRVANAPVSYGAFELTVGGEHVPAPDDVLAAIAAAGYEGTELGPLGYLGDRGTLHDRLERYGLALAGAFMQVRLAEPECWQEDLATVEATLDLLDGDAATARPVLADAGPRVDGGLDGGGWFRLAEGVSRAADLARARGLEPTFHHHTGTLVESPVEIERLLELTDVGLLLDTGHLLLAGGDPVRSLRAWRDRVDHVHVKDVRLGERAFCELGRGDVELEPFCADLVAGGYAGWLVVEQDWIPAPGETIARPAEAQARNRRWLAEHASL